MEPLRILAGDHRSQQAHHLIDRRGSDLHQARAYGLGVLGGCACDENAVVHPEEVERERLESRAGGAVAQVYKRVGVARHGGELREPHVELRIGQRGNLGLKSACGLSKRGRVELEEEIRVQLGQLRRDEAQILKPRLIAHGLGLQPAQYAA